MMCTPENESNAYENEDPKTREDTSTNEELDPSTFVNVGKPCTPYFPDHPLTEVGHVLL